MADTMLNDTCFRSIKRRQHHQLDVSKRPKQPQDDYFNLIRFKSMKEMVSSITRQSNNNNNITFSLSIRLFFDWMLGQLAKRKIRHFTCQWIGHWCLDWRGHILGLDYSELAELLTGEYSYDRLFQCLIWFCILSSWNQRKSRQNLFQKDPTKGQLSLDCTELECAAHHLARIRREKDENTDDKNGLEKCVLLETFCFRSWKREKWTKTKKMKADFECGACRAAFLLASSHLLQRHLSRFSHFLFLCVCFSVEIRSWIREEKLPITIYCFLTPLKSERIDD